MSMRSYTKVWLHLIWATQDRKKLLIKKSFRKKLSKYLLNYSDEKNIYMKINFVNSDHVHALIDLPADKTTAEVLQLLKGSSSHWINEHVNFKFAWAKGYAAFSISESMIDKVVKYIITQEEHHRVKSYAEEYNEFLKLHNIIRNR